LRNDVWTSKTTSQMVFEFLFSNNPNV